VGTHGLVGGDETKKRKEKDEAEVERESEKPEA